MQRRYIVSVVGPLLVLCVVLLAVGGFLLMSPRDYALEHLITRRTNRVEVSGETTSWLVQTATPEDVAMLLSSCTPLLRLSDTVKCGYQKQLRFVLDDGSEAVFLFYPVGPDPSRPLRDRDDPTRAAVLLPGEHAWRCYSVPAGLGHYEVDHGRQAVMIGKIGEPELSLGLVPGRWVEIAVQSVRDAGGLEVDAIDVDGKPHRCVYGPETTFEARDIAPNRLSALRISIAGHVMTLNVHTIRFHAPPP